MADFEDVSLDIDDPGMYFLHLQVESCQFVPYFLKQYATCRQPLPRIVSRFRQSRHYKRE